MERRESTQHRVPAHVPGRVLDRFTGVAFDELDFRSQASLGLSVIALLVVMPFAVAHLWDGRTALATSSLLLVAMLGVNALQIRRLGRTRRWLRLALVPLTVVTLTIATWLQGVVGLLWTYPTVLLYYALLQEREAWAATAMLLIPIVPVILVSMSTEIAIRGIATLLLVGLFAAILVRVISRQHRKLAAELVTDPLTGLLNRRALAESLEDAVAYARNARVPMTLLELDLDHFKGVNDEFGHTVGDEVLAEVGRTLLARLRTGDLAFRLGGEEFLVLLHGASAEDALRLAERLRTAIASSETIARYGVTSSVGLARLESDDTAWQTWFERADEALYRAKTAGRDRTVCAPEDIG